MVPYNGFCHSACKAPYLPHPTQLEALIVTISEAELARIVPICHPQAIVNVGVRTVATRSLPGHFNPFWDETFTFRRRAGPQPNRVSVLVVHVGRKVVAFGEATLPLTEDLILELWDHSATWWLPLPRRDGVTVGRLCISLKARFGKQPHALHSHAAAPSARSTHTNSQERNEPDRAPSEMVDMEPSDEEIGADSIDTAEGFRMSIIIFGAILSPTTQPNPTAVALTMDTGDYFASTPKQAIHHGVVHWNTEIRLPDVDPAVFHLNLLDSQGDTLADGTVSLPSLHGEGTHLVPLFGPSGSVAVRVSLRVNLRPLPLDFTASRARQPLSPPHTLTNRIPPPRRLPPQNPRGAFPTDVPAPIPLPAHRRPLTSLLR